MSLFTKSNWLSIHSFFLKIKMIGSRSFPLFILALTVFAASAQKAPIKFGKVDISELEMKYYDHDSTAPAVVLCDYGLFSIQNFKFKRIVRLKILNKEGYAYADKIFYFYNKTDIRGKTFNLVDGEIVTEKLRGESIFEERITEDYYAIRIAMPDVKVGSVIDLEFSHFGMPRTWRFQQRIPVKWSELIVERSPYITYQKNYFGYEPIDIITTTRWVAIDMPAFKPEPYIRSVENYLTKFEFDIQEIRIPERLYFKSIASSWKVICENLRESKYFGVPLRADHYLKKVTDEIERNYSAEKEKLIAAFEHAKKVKWNERSSKYISSVNLQVPYKEETGNSADINLILIQLLKRLDFEVYPVAISTRNNGRLSRANPSINKLNYVIANVISDSISYLLDATDELIPFGMLPKRCMNGEGRIIDEKKSDWIELKIDKIDERITYYDLQMDSEFSLTGKISHKYIDYGAYRLRKDYEEFANLDDYLDDYKSDKPGLKIIDTKMESVDDIYEPVKIEHEVKIDNQAMVLNEKIYLNPMLYDQMKENLFKIGERVYPVDFVYPFCKSFIIKLTIPENFSIIELPESVNMSLPDKSAKFIYSISNFANTINIMCKIDIDKAVYLQNEYPDLKEFYNQIIKKQSEPIIIQAK